MVVSLGVYSGKNGKFKCPDCSSKFDTYPDLKDHTVRKHKHNIPEGHSVARYLFNRRNNKDHGTCTAKSCNNETAWNEKLERYDRYCEENNGRCRKALRATAKKNFKRALGTDNPAATPEHQMKAIAARKTSGEYEFQDGGEVQYSSGYETHFLKFVDEDMGITSREIEQSEFVFWYNYNGNSHFHLSDFYMPALNLLIQVKSSIYDDNKKSHIKNNPDVHQKLGDQAIIESEAYNYIKVVDKDYGEFVNMVNILKRRHLDDNDKGELIIHLGK